MQRGENYDATFDSIGRFLQKEQGPLTKEELIAIREMMMPLVEAIKEVLGEPASPSIDSFPLLVINQLDPEVKKKLDEMNGKS